MKHLRGKAAFITGAASGIGFGIAQAFTEVGMKVMLADIEEEKLHEASEILQRDGSRVESVVCDVSDLDSINRAAQITIDDFKKVHVLCNNAGIAVAGSFQSYNLVDWTWIINVNLMGAIYGIRALLPHMKDHREGAHIINVGALSSLSPIPLSSAYSTTKGAILSLTESLAMELEDDGIGVSIILPAGVRSRLNESERNRPIAYTDTKLSHEHFETMAARRRSRNRAKPLEPIIVGRRTVEAIRNKELFVFTHRDWRERIEEKLARVRESLDLADKSPSLE